MSETDELATAIDVTRGATMGRFSPMTDTAAATTGDATDPVDHPVVFDVDDLSVYYGSHLAVRNVSMQIRQHEITAFIGPSGCGKTTALRCFNRMNDLIESARVEGHVRYHGVDLYDPKVNPVEVRRRIGMVFQKPNPFPKSIYDNVAYGPRIGGQKKGLDDVVEQSLQRAALWDEVKDRLKSSALDPIATTRIEDLMKELASDYTIVIVTHNMQQAARVSDRTAFFVTEVNETSDNRTGLLVEFDRTETMFSNPSDERTENYITGRFG